MAFVLAASEHGPLIVNRFDYHAVNERQTIGVGFEILEAGAYAQHDVNSLKALLELRRKYFGDGVFAIDCGANIGVHTIEWARLMTGWGSVLAIEAQERIFYALAGNIALNNCFNAVAMHAAVAAQPGTMPMPRVDYQTPASFGSLELKQKQGTEFIGQAVDYRQNTAQLRCVSLDSLDIKRVDLIKIDVEGMEDEALTGAGGLIAAHRPLLFVEWIKSPKAALRTRLEQWGYAVFELGMNFLAVHSADPSLKHIGPSVPRASS
jgi:FkbM family methyltransferase